MIHARLPWLLACGVAGAAVCFWFAALVPAEDRLAALRAGVAPHAHARPTVATAQRGAHRPREAGIPDLLDRLAGAVAQAGVPFDEANYQVVRLAQDRVVRYEIALPLRLAYPQLRALLEQLHGDLPELAVENVQLQRQKVGDEVLDVRLKLVVLLEARP